MPVPVPVPVVVASADLKNVLPAIGELLDEIGIMNLRIPICSCAKSTELHKKIKKKMKQRKRYPLF